MPAARGACSPSAGRGGARPFEPEEHSGLYAGNCRGPATLPAQSGLGLLQAGNARPTLTVALARGPASLRFCRACISDHPALRLAGLADPCALRGPRPTLSWADGLPPGLPH